MERRSRPPSWPAGRGSPDSQHGGAPAALLMRAFEGLRRLRAGDRPGHLRVRPPGAAGASARRRRGRSARPAGAADGGGDPHPGRHRGRPRPGAASACPPTPTRRARPQQPPPPGPEGGRRERLRVHPRTDVRARRAGDPVRRGRVLPDGPATAWFRMRKPIVAGEQTSPLQRLAAAGDFGNGIAAALPWDEYMFINPDLTLYIDRAAGRGLDRPGVADDRRRRAGSATPRACCTTGSAGSAGPRSRCWWRGAEPPSRAPGAPATSAGTP